jgi:GTP-binding protein
MIDAELEAEIRAQLPKGISTVFISAIAQQGLMELKDLLWTTMNPTL